MNYKILFEKFVKSSGLPSYIPNVGSLIKNVLIKTVLMNDFPAVIRVWQDCHIRSSHRRCSVKKLFSEILQNSQENTYARVSFLIKVKKKTLAQVFSCEFCAISKNTFLQNTSGRLLLSYFNIFQNSWTQWCTKMYCVDTCFFIWNIGESSSNETKSQGPSVSN